MSQLTDEDLVAVIGKGRSSMPAFGTVLSPEELRAVTDYVRSLSSGAGREEPTSQRPNHTPRILTLGDTSVSAPPDVRTGGVS